ncbi:ADP-ribose glycohydrolase MACROD1 isoform X1 [Phyllopteryx taeniolatus]|uniref:ADP-ribose glycohydrolase MACROD1 isoform X1 n=1 Tax=Phyllopteryx taeniolatus TaxID=161469 RepID=UPI002AD47EF4|nr:ADP-ribose glycohydrolase MACROD1 isoform X1 [Phyllopteryx taeniolatus]
MAIQISNLLSRIRTPLLLAGGPVFRVAAAVSFKHIILTPGGVQVGSRPATRPVPVRGHINTANFTTTTATHWRSTTGDYYSVPPRKQGSSGTVIGTGAPTGSLHTGAMAAMKVDLNATEGDWKEIKEFLLSQPLEVRRKHYRTDSVRLGDIPAWTHAGVSGCPEVSHYPKNQKLDGKISVYSGNITVLEVDAIVNAANQTLLGGGGVDGAIHRAAGPLLKKECTSLHGCQTGQAKVTCGYGLPAKYVIHTVGPIAPGSVGEAEKSALRSCYNNSLRKATENNARSVAFPCISTGIYGYPPEQAVHEALATVREYLEEHHNKLDRVIFCVFLPKDQELYLHNLPLYFPVEPTETPLMNTL